MADGIPIVGPLNRRQKKRKARRRGRHASSWEGSPRRHEQEVRAEVGALDAFTFLDAVSSVLAVAIDRAAHEHEARPAGSRMRETALLMAAIRAFRAIRAASAVVSSGYALEAEPYTRILFELYVSAKDIVDDKTGAEADAWLAGRRARGLGERVKASIPDPSVYIHLSQATHGDPRAVPRALLRLPEGEEIIEWGPSLTPQSTEHLQHLANAARDFAVLLEEVGFERCPELDEVDLALQRIKPGWRPDSAYPPAKSLREGT